MVRLVGIKILTNHNKAKDISCRGIFSVLKFSHLELFLKDHTIKSFETVHFTFNGKSVFDCKDGTLCPWPGCF